ncbi:hypothetical protein MKX03_001599 [Papaver bracteatum]|nr:hypothetical protein MKX03_001599 [Papaver bracteatum]
MKRTSPRREYCIGYVKDVQQQTPKLYSEFLQLIEKFKDMRRLDANTVEFHLKYTVLSERIKQIFKRHPELVSKFKPFLPDGYEDTVTVDQANGDGDEKELLHLEYSFFEKAETSLRSPDEYKQFLKCLYLYHIERISKDELQALTGFTYFEKEDILRRTTTSTEKKSDKSGGDCEKDERAKRPGFETSASKKRRLVEEPESMIARLLESKDVNPSYKRSTRKNNQICLFASGISTDPGDDEAPHYEPKKKPTETSSEYFKHTTYEENLFKCEDERVERDILSSTIERAEEIDDTCSLGDHFSVPQLGCIKRLFGKLGQHVMESFGENAILVLPLISTRLHQKLHEVSVGLRNSENELKLVSSGNSMLQNTKSSSTKEDAYTSWPNPLAELIV